MHSLVEPSLLARILDSGRTHALPDAGDSARASSKLEAWPRPARSTAARSAQLEWACDFALRVGDDLWSPRQVEAVREVAVEENNLADALREALTLPDAWSVVRLLTSAGRLLDHPRREPPGHRRRGRVRRGAGRLGATDEQVDVAVSAAATVALNTVGGEIGGVPASLALLDDFGDRTASARVRGLVAVVKAQVLGDPEGTVARLESIARGVRPGGRGGRPALGGAPPREQRRPERRHRPGRPGPGPGQRRRRPVDRGDAAHHGRHPAVPGRGHRGGRAPRAGGPAGARPPRRRRRRGPDALAARRPRHVGGPARRGRGVDGRDRAHPAPLERLRRCLARHGPRRDGPGPRTGRRGPGALPVRRRRAQGDQVPGDGRRDRAGAVGPVRREPRRHRPRRARNHPRGPRRRPGVLPRAPGQVGRSCSTRTAPSWTTPWPGWCCTGWAPGACCASRCRPTPPCCCSCWPSGSATPGSRPRCGPSAPTGRPRPGRPGWPRGCAPTSPDAPPPACCPRPGPRSRRVPGAAAAG